MTLSSSLETMAKSYGCFNGIIHKGGDGQIVKRRTTGTDIFITAFVTEYAETRPDIDLCGTGEVPLGIVIGPAGDQGEGWSLDNDSDDCFADNTWVNVYIPETGDELLLTVATNTTATQGVRQRVQAGFINTDWAYTNATAATDSLMDVYCVTVVGVSATGGTEKITLFRWL